ncbi:hypothetical protein GCM10011390_03360 [Aureimonas endophytica]|uniref:Uncharacterized protein n=1 Tax=Aureimonas endophytica TaxID=2027858 RepID=A0A916ZC66_9HYPH|nr:hypothetical protein [Aureimonas endophytica]GGD87939.1 hypothetical protein GCM10011390_03360 [Aureimonas endophytica]
MSAAFDARAVLDENVRLRAEVAFLRGQLAYVVSQSSAGFARGMIRTPGTGPFLDVASEPEPVAAPEPTPPPVKAGAFPPEPLPPGFDMIDAYLEYLALPEGEDLP